jgi:hypothetical protein
MGFLNTLEFIGQDPEGELLYQSALAAIASARKDGQVSGKHSPESWKEETIEEQASHASDHAYNFLCMFQEPDITPFNLSEAEHSLCRLAIAIALYKRQNPDA